MIFYFYKKILNNFDFDIGSINSIIYIEGMGNLKKLI